MFQFSSGTVLGRYELLIPVAQGGMADVWAARLNGSRGFTKLVAIKTIRPGALDDTRLEQMLMAEAQLAAAIQHPNVISTLELGEQENALFLVMEWADAEPLSVLLRGSKEDDVVPAPIAANIIAQACRGAHCAHELRDAEGNPLGVVHRDLSPQNLLLTYQGIVKVVDFGVAKATQRTSALTEDGELKGKLAYMSPEQVRGEAIDRRTDVFALGTILYLLTTGQHPFKCSHPAETLSRLASDAPVMPPNRKRPDYSPALQAVVMRALHKDRDQRYPTAEALLLALEDALPESKGIEAEVARFLFERCPGLGERRRQHIRTAGELLDRSENTPQSHSPTSISAVSVATPAGASSPSQVAARAMPEQVDFRSNTRRRWALAVGAVASSAVAILIIALMQSAPTPTPTVAGNALAPPAAGSIAVAAEHGAPAASPSSPTEQAETSTASTPATKNAAAPIAAVQEDAPGNEGRRRGSKAAHTRAVSLDAHDDVAAPGPAALMATGTPSSNGTATDPVAPATLPDQATSNRRASAPVPSSAEAASASEAQPSPRSRRQTSKTKKKDSWDPTTFGGRL